MFSDKKSINILTSLLVEYEVRHAVVCPGSRNAPIVHNLNACPDIQCYAVTDERSAGFYALGIAQCVQQPVAVCVTSGTALLNVMPAVAEAYYQRIPLVVISADRPPQWIDQLDGQTLPQPDALGRFVRKAVSLPEIAAEDTEQQWYCNRLVCEALIAATHQGNGPVHINVPISEPLFNFTTAALPKERKIELLPADMPSTTSSHVLRMFMQSKRPMLISGQPLNPNLDEAVYLVQDDERYVPDFVLYIGGSIVSKRVKHFLRKAKETWAVNPTGEVNDTFQNLTHVIEGDGEVLADLIRFMLENEPHPFVQQWDTLLKRVSQHSKDYVPAYSQMAAVKELESQLDIIPTEYTVHYANSTAIRLANIYAWHYVFCNRGVNGIEGSLSTATGYSLVARGKVLCVIGDLSFFYDQNALWNRNINGDLRILLLNNGKGGIFNMLRGLEQSDARDTFVAAEHDTRAEGICKENGVEYLKAENMDEMRKGIHTLLYIETSRPVLLEVLTDAEEDTRAYRDYYHSLKA